MKSLVGPRISDLFNFFLGANGIVSSQERILAFGRYLMQEGAKPISGPNEGEDYHLYQEFYKRKTKLAKDDFVRLKKIIDACNVEALENELDSSVTVQCSKWIIVLCISKRYKIASDVYSFYQ